VDISFTVSCDSSWTKGLHCHQRYTPNIELSGVPHESVQITIYIISTIEQCHGGSWKDEVQHSSCLTKGYIAAIQFMSIAYHQSERYINILPSSSNLTKLVEMVIQQAIHVALHINHSFKNVKCSGPVIVHCFKPTSSQQWEISLS